MPTKPDKRQYRAMVTPLAVMDETVKVVNGETGEELTRPANRFASTHYAEGYATTFDDPYTLFEDIDGWRYVEVIDRHALDDADMSDVILQYDHEGRVFARNSNHTLHMEVDDHGLFVAADLSKTTLARQMHEDIAVGNVTAMSWAFVPLEETYTEDFENKVHTTRVTRVGKVYDVSAVSLPADPNTEISARRAIDGAIEARRSRESGRRELARMREEVALKAKLLEIR